MNVRRNSFAHRWMILLNVRPVNWKGIRCVCVLSMIHTYFPPEYFIKKTAFGRFSDHCKILFENGFIVFKPKRSFEIFTFQEQWQPMDVIRPHPIVGDILV